MTSDQSHPLERLALRRREHKCVSCARDALILLVPYCDDCLRAVTKSMKDMKK